MILNPKHVSNLPSYINIINGVLPNLLFKIDKNPDEMEIKDELVLNGTTWTSADKIKYNTIGAFTTCDSNMPGYYIILWTGNSYTLQGKYIFYAFDPFVIIPEGDLVFPANFMTQMRKTS